MIHVFPSDTKKRRLHESMRQSKSPEIEKDICVSMSVCVCVWVSTYLLYSRFCCVFFFLLEEGNGGKWWEPHGTAMKQRDEGISSRPSWAWCPTPMAGQDREMLARQDACCEMHMQ